MPDKRILVVIVATLVGSLVAGSLIVRHRHLRSSLARAEKLLAEAAEIIRESGEENIIRMASDLFAEAQAAIKTARDLLSEGQTDLALEAAVSALDKARQARDHALGTVAEAPSAILDSYRNKVLYRPAQGIAWSDVRPKMKLFDRDRVATKEQSEAILRFDETNEMRVDENSVVVVERLERSPIESALSMTVSLTEGSLRSLSQSSGGRDARIELNLPESDVLIDTARSRGKRVEVGASITKDLTNRVSVYSGQAEVVSASGQKLRLEQNHYVEVSAERMALEPKELPKAVKLLQPASDATVFVNVQRPEVGFRWEKQEGCVTYRLEVARDSSFLPDVLDSTVTTSRLTTVDLGGEEYVWRARCISQTGVEGAFSEVRTFAVVFDNEPPQVAVLSPEGNAVVNEASVEVRCRTEPSAIVFVNGEEASRLGEGVYTRVVRLNRGLNTLVFEAVDAAGNVGYRSRLITRAP